MKLLLPFLLFGLTCSSLLSNEIVPDGWIDPESLEAAEDPIQQQLDTGIAMNSTAWSMAAVKDARLFVIYVQLFQELDKDAQEKLLKEQKAWLLKRKKVLESMNDPDGGTIVSLEQASKQMRMTDERIARLEDRLRKIKKSKRTAEE